MQYDAIRGERTTMRLAPTDMPVVDGRAAEAEFSLDREGFMLVHHRTSVTDFLDRQQTDVVYPEEAAALIKTLTGADHAFATGTNVRFGDKREDGYTQTSDHKPAGFPAWRLHRRVRKDHAGLGRPDGFAVPALGDLQRVARLFRSAPGLTLSPYATRDRSSPATRTPCRSCSTCRAVTRSAP